MQKSSGWFFLNSIDSWRSFLAVNLRCRNWKRIPLEWRQLAIVRAPYWSPKWPTHFGHSLCKSCYCCPHKFAGDWDQHKQVKCKNRVTSFWSEQNYGHLVIVQSYAADTAAMTTVPEAGTRFWPHLWANCHQQREKCFLFSLSFCWPQKPQQAPRKTRLPLVASIVGLSKMLFWSPIAILYSVSCFNFLKKMWRGFLTGQFIIHLGPIYTLLIILYQLMSCQILGS